jgi:hypothetical protein
MESSMRRARNKSLPATPQNAAAAKRILENIGVDADFVKTFDGMDFFAACLESEGDYNLLFLSHTIIDTMEETNGDWYFDATFSVVPNVFFQLLTIHIMHKEYVSTEFIH